MAQIILFAIICIIILIFCISLLANGIAVAVKKARGNDFSKCLYRIKKAWPVAAVAFCILLVFSFVSQSMSSTPDIAGENSIAELREVELNGRKEWISVRGNDKDNPVLLFLAGGPGGTQMAAVRHELAELEDHFVVVNWDQPGSGKSFSVIAQADLTPQTYIDDSIALTQYLNTEFGVDKIYLLGESWGSALGIFMAAERPELYHAFIGTGQMVAFVETEKIDYELALELARQSGDEKLVADLEDNGPPPYYGSDVTWKSAKYLNYLSGVMARNPEISNSGFQTSRDIGSSEYGVIDKINYLRGVVASFNNVYPQLYDIDLRVDYSSLEIPVYFLLGRHDINAPVSLAQDYYETLDAPHKELIWFENSGHSPWINESQKFVEEIVDIANMN